MAALWFCLAAVTIVGYVLLDGFDLGAGIVELFVAKTACETNQVIRSIGPVWDGNEVWLLVLGGTLVFAFPTLYASAFSGFYLSLMIVLWLLILRGIAIEFRHHLGNPQWQQFWGGIFGLASSALALLFGVALGNVVRGVPVDQSGYFFLPLWTNFLPSSQAGIIDWYTLLVGAASFLALAVHGSLWVVMKTDGTLQERTRLFAARCWTGLMPVMLVMTAASFAIQPHLLEQFRSNPWGGIFPTLAIVGLIGSRVVSARGRDLEAFLASSLYVLGMLTSVAFAMFPNVLPSNIRPDLGLTIYNAAAAEHGLFVGLCWFIPGTTLAVTYSTVVYRRFAGKVA
jgi:cytochrome bd ubiquinol oxidase subunit II